eukprot:TRINITY_DN2882_c0_g2_i1.p1 TRINITY_DN2882_c0_g2~~TRINITY_DN2882_c0_g2_i1.p1  ORF type:complete len:414 (-),score=90.22 TRINITY_DN2882_c0_g2_i1:996-2237(-)
MVKETKLYDLLGVKPDAEEEHIKKAFRKKALQLHPDRETDPDRKKEKEKLFAEVSNAHEILTDSELRARYDKFGMKGIEEGGGGGESGPSDFFSQMFGGGGGGGRRKEQKPKDTMHQLEVPLEQFYMGATRKLAIRRLRFCSSCGGAGTKSGKDATCGPCRGQGHQVVLRQLAPGFAQPMHIPCRECNGSGKAVPDTDKCGTCNAERVVEDRKVFDVHVEPGMKEGDAITFTGEGNQIPGVRLSGNVVILLAGVEHDHFTRKGSALLTKAEVSIADALCGFEMQIQHLDGRVLVVKPMEGGQILKPRSLYVVAREGMPVKGTGGSERGELVIDLKIVFPDQLKPAQQEKLRTVLGAQTPPVIPDTPSTEGGYETHMTEVRASLEALAQDDRRADQEDDEQGPRGMPQMGCAAQ